MSGIVYKLHAKTKSENGIGLPKEEFQELIVTKNGPENDYNNYRQRKLANTPDRALSIMTLEMIHKLNDEGWPIKPGDIGENITTSGIDYYSFKIGAIYKIGNVKLQITEPIKPCKNLATLSYVGEENKTRFIQELINRRGWYARVLEEGKITPGNSIHLS